MNIRHYHKKVSLIIFIPLFVVVVSGLVLQLRNQFEWIQPKTISGPAVKGEVLSYEKILSNLNLTEAQIDQVIYRPRKKNLAVRLTSGEEIQLDPATGTVLKRAVRRTNIFIEIHQGSILGSFGQYGIYFLSGLGLLFLLISGGILLLPKKAKHV